LENEALGVAAAFIGRPSFYRVLKDQIGALVGSEVSMVMRYSRSAAPAYVCYDDLDPRLMDDYLKNWYRIDPVYEFCKNETRSGVYTLDSVGTSAAYNMRYLRQFLSQTGMVDDLVALFPALASTTIGLVFEKSVQFSSAQVERLGRLYPVLAGLQSAHERVQLTLITGCGSDTNAAFRIFDVNDKPIYDSDAWTRLSTADPQIFQRIDALRLRGQQTLALEHGFIVRAMPLPEDNVISPGGMLLLIERGNPGMSPISPLQAIDAYADANLTPRERDIIRLIFLGYPNSKIAERLNLSINTVKNHRKRLYLKLDITSERELFLAFMSALLRENDLQPSLT
jgi:DNA-binding CsgD family transcriptional regulator